MKAKGVYTVKSWEENAYKQISSSMKMTKASVVYEFKGDFEGTASAEYLMFYSHFDVADQHKSSAAYIGLFRFTGKLGGRSGSFVMKDDGTFVNGSADSTLAILDGSGTDALTGIAGKGMYRANKDGLLFELEYEMGNEN